MRKKILASLMCALFLVPAFLPAAESAARIRQATMSRIDMNGEYLSYQNMTELMAKITRLPDVIQDIVKACGASGEEQKMIREGAKIFVNVMNLQALKAVAVSSTKINDDTYCLKHYAYMGKDAKKAGIFTITGENETLDWRSLPADTVLAFSVRTNLMPIYRSAIKELSSSTIPDFRKIADAVKELKKEGIDLETILEGTHGTVSGYVAGTSAADISFKLEIPDVNGLLSEQLKKELPPEQGTNVAKQNQKDDAFPSIDPILVYGKGKLTLYSSEKVRNARPFKTLGRHPYFRNLSLPSRGCGYLIVKVDQKLVDGLIELTEAEPEWQALLQKYLKPFYFAGVASSDDAGALSVIYSTVSIPDLIPAALAVATLAVPPAMLLPALNKAREKAREASCLCNLKMIGLGLAQYACDYNNNFPGGNAAEAFQTLIKKKYIDSSSFICPASGMQQGKNGQFVTSYCYVGSGFNSSELNGNVPIAFDLPGHHDGCVNVLFGNGHAEQISIQEYHDPMQVIRKLDQEHHFPKKVLRKLQNNLR